MALATRCPACTTVFRISTAQAAAKGGMVRCGVCRNVFNSLDALVRVEELDVVEEVLIEPDVDTTDATVVAAKPRGDTVFEERAEPRAAPTDRAEPDFLGERATTSAWWLPEIEPQRTTSGGPATGGRTATSVALPTAVPISARPDDIAPEAASMDAMRPDFGRRDGQVEPASSALRWMLSALSLVATLALLGQLAYLWRDELAARWSPARPWLAAACVPLGCTVSHPVHAASITIESASVQTSSQGVNIYAMTALLRNRDTIDLRYPHLELVLTDLQDRPILRRDLGPDDYLPAGRTSSAGFPAESELPIRVAFELNNLRFAGYRINQFYP